MGSSFGECDTITTTTTTIIITIITITIITIPIIYLNRRRYDSILRIAYASEFFNLWKLVVWNNERILGQDSLGIRATNLPIWEARDIVLDRPDWCRIECGMTRGYLVGLYCKGCIVCDTHSSFRYRSRIPFRYATARAFHFIPFHFIPFHYISLWRK